MLKGELIVLAIRTLLVVDAEGFSRNRDSDLPGLHIEIRDAVAAACDRSGLSDTWKAVRFLESRGDGLLAALPQEAAVPLIHPFSDRLQDVLAESAQRLRALGLRLRLRVALHFGLVDDEHPVAPGISAATNDVCRLVDCEPLKAALRNSDPDVTFVAVIVSSEAFETFVRGGHTGLQPSQFTKIQAKVKQFDRPAFLYVPAPSECKLPEQSQVDGVPHTAASSPASGTSLKRVKVTGKAAQNIIGNQVGGSIWQERS